MGPLKMRDDSAAYMGLCTHQLGTFLQIVHPWMASLDMILSTCVLGVIVTTGTAQAPFKSKAPSLQAEVRKHWML